MPLRQWNPSLFRLLLVSLCAFATLPALAQSGTIVGTWNAVFVDSNQPPQFTLPALATFNGDGTMTETDGGELPPFQGTYASPGHGVWRKLADGKYDFKFLSIVVNQDGSAFATGTIHQVLNLTPDGNSFTGYGVYSFIDS